MLLLASTPALLIAQMLLLPVYLRIFLGEAASGLVQAGPFIHAFVWLITLPLALAACVQLAAARSGTVDRIAAPLGLLLVPAPILVLFLVAAVVPQLGLALVGAMSALPVYVAFAVTAPVRRVGGFVAHCG